MQKKSQFSMDLLAILSPYPTMCVNMNIIDLITKKCVYRVCKNDACRMFRPSIGTYEYSNICIHDYEWDIIFYNSWPSHIKERT